MCVLVTGEWIEHSFPFPSGTGNIRCGLSVTALKWGVTEVFKVPQTLYLSFPDLFQNHMVPVLMKNASQSPAQHIWHAKLRPRSDFVCQALELLE